MNIRRDKLSNIIRESLLYPIFLNDSDCMYDVIYSIKNDLFMVFNVTVDNDEIYVGGTLVENNHTEFVDLIDVSIIDEDEFFEVYVKGEF
jgi:hypothetical protein